MRIFLAAYNWTSVRSFATTLFVLLSAPLLTSPATGGIVQLTPSSIENGDLHDNYYGNGYGGSGYTLLTSTELEASSSAQALATHFYATFHTFAIEFDLRQFNNSVVESATLKVDEQVSNYRAILYLFSTTQPVGLDTFQYRTPVSERTIPIQEFAPTTIDLTAAVRDAVGSGADHLTIAVQNGGGHMAGTLYRHWSSSYVTWSNPRLIISVPEPSSWTMLLSGSWLALMLAGWRRYSACSSPTWN